ncbi:MAG TPA: hypothetical protein VK864_11545 [Longimicrobiales bacterium]|nr:hypothetical protein [Longimicrobiales bacterium]
MIATSDRTAVPETQSGIPVWRRESRGRLGTLGPFYRAGYLNAFLTGRVDDGREFALVAGTHSRHYPYRHPKSKWDDVLLVIGADTYLATGRRISSLGLALGPRDAASVFYNGRAFARSGAAVQLDFQFNLFARVFPPRPQGIGTRYAVLGLQWQPALVIGTGSLTIHDTRLRVSQVIGEMERGGLTSLRGRWFEFGYDYLCSVRERETPAACVDFRTYALHPGRRGLLLRALLRLRPATELLTLGPDRLEPGDPHKLRPQRDTNLHVMLTNRVDLGPATISRQIVRINEAGNAGFALHETFTPNQ